MRLKRARAHRAVSMRDTTNVADDDAAVTAQEHVERGGLAWGGGVWSTGGGYVSWPFVTLRVTRDRLRLTVRPWRWFAKLLATVDRSFHSEHVFELSKLDVEAIHRKRTALFSTGVTIEHHAAACPPFVLFWTFQYDTLSNELRRMGYRIVESRE